MKNIRYILILLFTIFYSAMAYAQNVATVYLPVGVNPHLYHLAYYNIAPTSSGRGEISLDMWEQEPDQFKPIEAVYVLIENPGKRCTFYYDPATKSGSVSGALCSQGGYNPYQDYFGVTLKRP